MELSELALKDLPEILNAILVNEKNKIASADFYEVDDYYRQIKKDKSIEILQDALGELTGIAWGELSKKQREKISELGRENFESEYKLRNNR
jgi:hypothetical protein